MTYWITLILSEWRKLGRSDREVVPNGLRMVLEAMETVISPWDMESGVESRKVQCGEF